tara:strand:- start:18 stop:257 length:240 start_codon:yes stop_codon:yes gene_type:complete
MSEWFYINRWRLNASKVWCLYDSEEKVFIMEDVTRAEVEDKNFEMNNPKLLIVNKFDRRYNEIVNKRGSHEHHDSKRRV